MIVDRGFGHEQGSRDTLVPVGVRVRVRVRGEVRDRVRITVRSVFR